MRIKVTYTNFNVSVTRPVIKVFRVTPIGLPSGITTELLTEEGQLIVCLSPGVAMVIDPPTANGQTIVADLEVPGLWKIGAPAASGGVITLTNKDSTTAYTGSVVIPDLSADEAFLGTTVPGHLGVIGVSAEDIGINTEGKVAIAALNDVLVAGNVARGEWLISSATKWRAKTAGFDKPLYGALGYALTAYSGGGNGSVSAVVMPDPKHLTTAGTAWAVGGGGGSGTTNAQKFTVASATWATVASAALPAARFQPGGLGYGTTAGYTIGGNDGSASRAEAYKTPFATETTASQGSAALPDWREAIESGCNGSAKGYIAGGYKTQSATAQSSVTVLTYATDTMSAALGTTLSLARYYDKGVSDGTRAYVQGGTVTGGALVGTSDMITLATDVVSDNNSGDVANENYSGFSFASSNGYLATRTGAGATNLSKKIVLSTGVSANVTSTLPADQYTGAGIADGAGLAWLSGHSVSPYSLSHKFTLATETYAADAGAVMNVGKYRAASFNNGAY